MKAKLQELRRQFDKHRVAYYFILPTALGMLLLHAIPIVQGIWMSMLDLRLSTLSLYLMAPFIGLRNYYDIVLNPTSPIRIGLLEAVRNTVIYTIIVTIGTIGVGLIVALMLNRKFTGRNMFRTLFLFPWVIPTYVTGLLWGFMWQKDIGVINIFLADILHVIKEKPFWLLGPNTLWAIIIPTIWRYWPLSMLMLLAGLQTIPDELYEAAEIDGASGWKKFWTITLPLLKPVWSILILFGLIYNTYSFNIVIMMFGYGAGFPGEWGDLMMTNIFRNAFQVWNFGVGAATSFLLMIVMILIVNLWFKFYKKAEDMLS